MSNNTEEKMTFVTHLIELRDKLIRIVIAILVVFIALFPFANDIYTIIANPIIASMPSNSGMIAIGVISPFLTPLKLALIVAVYITMPYLLYQIWSFVAPGLYRDEKRLIAPLVISSTLLFYAGIVFAFFVVFPLAFDFLANIGPSVINFSPDIQHYLDFVLKVSFAFGVAFEVPIATILLIMFGATTPEKLKKNRPYIVIGAFVVGMLLTPPDIISQTLIAIPMLILFELGLLFAPLFTKRKKEVGKQYEKESEKESEGENELYDSPADLDDIDDDEFFDEIDKEFKDIK
jgi:sec-independent protein translocase protein TatC